MPERAADGPLSADGSLSADGPLSAGDFSSWLAEVLAAIRGEGATDVACGSCVACCSSAQFVHIAPDEQDVLAHVPEALLFPAPGLPRGHVLMGYDEHGRCPMLRTDGCSIYEHRPRTCRTYDCRVFPAAGVLPDEPGKAPIATQAARWEFTYASSSDSAEHAAARAAAAFLRSRHDALGTDLAPATTTQLAVAALEVHRIFVHQHEPSVHDVRVELSSRRSNR